MPVSGYNLWSPLTSIIIIIIVWQACPVLDVAYERSPGLTILCWTTGGCQTNVEWC